MKAAIPYLLAGVLGFGGVPVSGSESAPDCVSAVETLRAGIAVHADQAVALFRDSLQTNPGCRRELLLAALGILGDDPDFLVRLLYAARLEFPGDDALFAEAALATVPACAAEIRGAFAATPGQMETALAGAPFPVPATATRLPASPDPDPNPVGTADFRALDEEIRDAIARVTAKAEGRSWPEQAAVREPVHFRKQDEIRISRQSRRADETSLYNLLPLDRNDEREVVPGPVRLEDDADLLNSFRLDESKFARNGTAGSVSPADAKSRAIAPAGAVGLPRRPVLPRSSVYRIPPAADSYESTIDRESGPVAAPPLIIRPEPASPSAPRPAGR